MGAERVNMTGMEARALWKFQKLVLRSLLMLVAHQMKMKVPQVQEELLVSDLQKRLTELENE
jgi:hypothetical protein